MLMDAIEKAGYTGKVSDVYLILDFGLLHSVVALYKMSSINKTRIMQIKIGMDVAASEFYTKDGKYDLNFKKQPNDGSHVHTAQSLCELYKEFVRDFPIVSIEDPFDQDDWGSWAALRSSVDIQLVGDDLLVTNPKRIAEAIEKKACNALLLKVKFNCSNGGFMCLHLLLDLC